MNVWLGPLVGLLSALFLVVLVLALYRRARNSTVESFHAERIQEIKAVRADWGARADFWIAEYDRAEAEQDLLAKALAQDALAFLIDTEPPAPEPIPAKRAKQVAAAPVSPRIQARPTNAQLALADALYPREVLTRACLECQRPTKNQDEAGDPWCEPCLEAAARGVKPVVEMTHVAAWATKICEDCDRAAMATFDERPNVGVCRDHYRDLDTRHRLHLKPHESGYYVDPLKATPDELEQAAAKLVRRAPKQSGAGVVCDFCKQPIPAEAFRVWNNGKAVCSDCTRGISY